STPCGMDAPPHIAPLNCIVSNIIKKPKNALAHMTMHIGEHAQIEDRIYFIHQKNWDIFFMICLYGVEITEKRFDGVFIFIPRGICLELQYKIHM
ncbi:hypothetical protein ACJX0J_033786, partial [Zea mays]